jgi:hypothetical protein
LLMQQSIAPALRLGSGQAFAGWRVSKMAGRRANWGTGDREAMKTPRGASRWPDWRATCPGLPSTSSIRMWTWRVSGRRRADEGRMAPPGVYCNKTGCYHTGSVNVL